MSGGAGGSRARPPCKGELRPHGGPDWCQLSESNRILCVFSAACAPATQSWRYFWRGVGESNASRLIGNQAHRPPCSLRVGNRRIELRTHIGAGFTDPLSHQTWRCPFGCGMPELNRLSPGYEPGRDYLWHCPKTQPPTRTNSAVLFISTACRQYIRDRQKVIGRAA